MVERPEGGRKGLGVFRAGQCVSKLPGPQYPTQQSVNSSILPPSLV